MRTISSRRFVGVLAPPLNVSFGALGAGKIPAFSNDWPLALIIQEGMMLPGNVPPCTIPDGAVPPGQFANSMFGVTCAVVGTLRAVGSELKSPPNVLGSGTVW